MLAKHAIRIVSLQQVEEVVLVTPTPFSHQEVGSIKLHPEARRNLEGEKQKEKEKDNENWKEKGKTLRTSLQIADKSHDTPLS